MNVGGRGQFGGGIWWVFVEERTWRWVIGLMIIRGGWLGMG